MTRLSSRACLTQVSCALVMGYFGTLSHLLLIETDASRVNSTFEERHPSQ